MTLKELVENITVGGSNIELAINDAATGETFTLTYDTGDLRRQDLKYAENLEVDHITGSYDGRLCIEMRVDDFEFLYIEYMVRQLKEFDADVEWQKRHSGDCLPKCAYQWWDEQRTEMVHEITKYDDWKEVVDKIDSSAVADIDPSVIDLSNLCDDDELPF